MPTGLVWTVPPQTAWEQLAGNYMAAIQRGVYAICQKWQPEVENWMKANAPWTDRTTAARSGLYAEVHQVVNQLVEVIVAHAVEYGFYLEGWDPVHNHEMLNAGQWAIVNPAIDHFAPLIWRDVVQMLS